MMDDAAELVFAYINDVYKRIAAVDSLFSGIDDSWKTRMYDENGEILVDSQLLSFLIVLTNNYLDGDRKYKITTGTFDRYSNIACYYKQPGLVFKEYPIKPPLGFSGQCGVRSNLSVAPDCGLFHGLSEYLYCFDGIMDTVPVPRTLKSIPKDAQVQKEITPSLYGYIIHSFWVMLQLYAGRPKWFYFSLRNIIHCADDYLETWQKCCFKAANQWIEVIKTQPSEYSACYVSDIAHSSEFLCHILYENGMKYGIGKAEFNEYKESLVKFFKQVNCSLSSLFSGSKQRALSGIRNFISNIEGSAVHLDEKATKTTYVSIYGYIGHIFLSLIELMRHIGAGGLGPDYNVDLGSFTPIVLKAECKDELQRRCGYDETTKTAIEAIEDISEYQSFLARQINI